MLAEKHLARLLTSSNRRGYLIYHKTPDLGKHKKYYSVLSPSYRGVEPSSQLRCLSVLRRF